MIRQGMRKTTKAMRAFETRNRGIGLGDLVWIVTTCTGIRFVVEKWKRFSGTYCGCQTRREKLNGIRFMSPIGFGFMSTIAPRVPAGQSRQRAENAGPPPRPIPPEALFGPEHFEEVPDGTGEMARSE